MHNDAAASADGDLTARIARMEERVNDTHRMVKQVRTWFLWILIASVIGFVFPLIGLAFAIPKFLASYASLGI